ncbi:MULTISPECIES: hypothetical protein [unclassified Haladaptatus]|uniref:hypothetical protein n=2 Tax=Haladaptatus TaxID=367188 RepID=UPI00209C63FC|nr:MULTISPECIES: hypothetical protein [unclassified Haladaptatus]MCO8245073.1 hypothetical protein [Haladaptatus sp. AB643]MCO8253215.1 hypothetical protein [Haladaptatus sp. AB618]
MIPLFGPVPGGMELIVIFIMAILLFGVPLTIFGGIFVLHRRSQEQVSELRDEVDELRTELETRERERERE